MKELIEDRIAELRKLEEVLEQETSDHWETRLNITSRLHQCRARIEELQWTLDLLGAALI